MIEVIIMKVIDKLLYKLECCHTLVRIMLLHIVSLSYHVCLYYTQNTLVANAYSKLLNSSLEARSENVNDTRELPTINGTYALGKEGKITVNVYNSGSGLLFSTSGLVTDSGYVNTTNAQKLGDSGSYILFPSTTNLAGASFVIDIPNKKASDYLTNENAYNSALKTRESARCAH